LRAIQAAPTESAIRAPMTSSQIGPWRISPVTKGRLLVRDIRWSLSCS
jgi:hypothetical protein